jgi:hypothetical protein
MRACVHAHAHYVWEVD